MKREISSRFALLALFPLEGGSKSALEIRETMEREYNASINPTLLLKLLAQLVQSGWIEIDKQEHGDIFYRLTSQGESIRHQQYADTQKWSERIVLTRRSSLIIEKEMRSAGLVRWLLRWYPTAWRERYEQEMLALLDQHTITPATLLDLWMGALDAHLKGGYYKLSPALFFKDMQTTTILFIGAVTLFFLVLRNWLNGGWPFFMSLDGHPFQFSLFDWSSFVVLWGLLLGVLGMLGVLVKGTRRGKRKKLLWPALPSLISFIAFPFLYEKMLLATLPLVPNSYDLFLRLLPVRLLPEAGLLASSLFVILLTGREAIASGRKAPFFLLGLLLLAEIGTSPDRWFFLFLDRGMFLLPILPFLAGPVALALAVAKRRISRRMLRLILIPASLLFGFMAISLLATVAVSLYILISGHYGGGNRMIPQNLWMICMELGSLVAVLALAGTIIIAALAMRRAFRELKEPEAPSIAAVADQVIVQVQHKPL